MNALSRREEETLSKTAKAKALKECDSVVKGACTVVVRLAPLSLQAEFASCATGRTFSVAWECRDKYKAVQDCMYQ